MKSSPIHSIKFLLISIVVSLASFTFIITAFAFQVPLLPGNNLVENPWFRSSADPTLSSLDGWSDAAGINQYWSTSQKASNPSPDIFVNELCGSQPTYCGTAARLSPTPGQTGGIGKVGIDAYLYQVVQANESSCKLKFFAHWVSHKIDPAEVTIYGADSQNGPWSEVWVPFYHQQFTVPPPPPGGQADLWTQTGFLEKTLERGYPYYKIEIHARLPDSELVGFKITGVYFATEGHIEVFFPFLTNY